MDRKERKSERNFERGGTPRRKERAGREERAWKSRMSFLPVLFLCDVCIYYSLNCYSFAIDHRQGMENRVAEACSAATDSLHTWRH
jgi:hypothetical protein